MIICYRCGERTVGDHCQWYGFSMMWGIQARHRKAGKLAKKEAGISAREQALREAELTAKQRAEREAEKAKKAREVSEPQKVAPGTGSGMYQGDFKIVVSSPVSLGRVREFRESLERIENLKVLWAGGGADKGTIIAVSLQNPMPLIPIFNKIQTVEKAEKMGESILVMLKTSPGS
ncbi:hypothetical protein ACFLUO_09900 [Chloroflexota bacterium]